jgi:hypothetical protein
MPLDPGDFEPFSVLAEWAAHLNAIAVPGRAEPPFYELMSGALVWRDETRPDSPVEVIRALRLVCAYRTSITLGQPKTELAKVWEHAMSHFPKWVGFLPERRASNPELLAIYRRGSVSLRKCLRDMQAAEADA